MPGTIKVTPKNSKNIFKLYEPMMVMLLIFGFNFDFYNHKFILKNIARIYCVTFVAVISFATIACCDQQEISQIWTLLEYSLSVIVILFFKSRMKVFLERISELDTYLRIHRNHYYWDRYKMLIVTILIWVTRILYTYLYCTELKCYNDLLMYLISLLAPIALDLNRVWRCILFDAIRYRLKMLRVRMEETPCDNYYLYVKNNKALKEDKIKFCLYIYRTIADMVELVSPELHASLFMSVTCNLPKMIINVYHILTVMEGLEPQESLGFVIVHLIQIGFLLFTPFFIVEFYAIEVERIQILLINRRIEETDPEIQQQIKLFLRYISIRPLKYRIWRIIPINISLPLALINLCTTYVIVIINFTHLYG